MRKVDIVPRRILAAKITIWAAMMPERIASKIICPVNQNKTD